MKKIWIGSGLSLIALLGYALVEPHRHVIKEYHITHPNIPKDFEGFKIAFLADIHYGRLTKKHYLAKVIQRVNAMRPDIVLLGGDYITHKKYIKPCFDMLKDLKSKHGSFGVLGNHDVIENEALTYRCMQDVGVRSINNQATWIKRGKTSKIKVGGVGDLTTQSQDLTPTTRDLMSTDYVILVTHNPKYIYDLKNTDKIGLVLAGHTHGAQASSVKHLSKVLSQKMSEKAGLKYLTGHYNEGDTDIIVSNGIGTAKFPFRFMTPPEVVMITLHSKQ